MSVAKKRSFIQANGSNSRAELQYGFKSKVSTSLCTVLLKCVVSCFLRESSPGFACFLDASKAFDLVNRSILYFKGCLKKVFQAT